MTTTEDDDIEIDRLTPSAPERIWLQIDAGDSDRSGPYPADHDGISWCWESVGGAEVDYLRSDLVRAVLPQNWQDDPGWARLAPLLGASEPAASAPAICRDDLLAPKHTGMRISADGILGRIRDGRYFRGLNYGCGVLLDHLNQMAARFYAGDIRAVDEFLQLYCLDEHRPETSTDVQEGGE